GPPRVPQGRERLEMPTGRVRTRAGDEERRNRHQPGGPEAGGAAERFQDRAQRVRHDALLRALARDGDLDWGPGTHADLLRQTIETLQQGNRVDGVNPREESEGAARLVRLKMADEVPGQGNLRRADDVDLVLGLLHTILADVRQTGVHGRLNA